MSSKRHSGPVTGGGALSWVPWVAAVAVIAVIAVVAVVVARNDAEAKVQEWDTGAPVTVTGDPLPILPEAGDDPAIGMAVPELSGTSVRTGEPLTLDDSGKGRIIVVTAHWCPHCQNEIPKIVEHLKDSPLPDDVELVGLTTGMDRSAGNFPPSAWLEKEDWSAPTLIDDAEGTGAAALGVSGFPFFLVVGPDGDVRARASGSIDMSRFDAIVEAAAGRG